MQQAASEKRRLFREWQRTREENDQKRYREANKECKRVVAVATEKAYTSAVRGVERKGRTKKDLQASQCQEKNGNGNWKSNSCERQGWHIANRG